MSIRPRKIVTRLEGNPADLSRICDVPEFSDYYIREEGDGVFIIEGPLHCDPIEDDRRARVDPHCEVEHLNDAVLPLMVALAELRHSGHWFGPITASGAIKDDQGNVTIAGGHAQAFASAFPGTILGQPGPETFTDLVADSHVQDALRFFHDGLFANWTVNLGKAFEVITLDVGQRLLGSPGTSMGELKSRHREGKNAIVNPIDLAWVSQPDTDRFLGTLNRRDSSGRDARHALSVGVPDPNPMTKAEATKYLRSLLRTWIRLRTTIVPRS